MLKEMASTWISGLLTPLLLSQQGKSVSMLYSLCYHVGENEKRKQDFKI